MERLVTEDIEHWYENNTKMCLLIDGARQVGKTYIVREFAKKHRGKFSFVEINLHDDRDAKNLLSRATTSDELLKDLDLLYRQKLVPGKTVIFIDEVQECLNLVTAVKFLVEDGRYRYILSGSLLGVTMVDAESVPVGYMQVLQMYPLNFREFGTAVGMTQAVFDYLEDCFTNLKPVDEAIHHRVMLNFRDYLLVGGMPAAVDLYVKTQSHRDISNVHASICKLYETDISKYDSAKKPLIKRIFQNIPGELNSQCKRFKFSTIGAPRLTRTAENAFLWLAEAGVAIPVYNVDEPKAPLSVTNSTLFKLFMCDVGILSYMYFDDELQVKIYSDNPDINFGAIYENFVAQEVKSNDLTPYYYSNRTYGELDLVVQINGKAVPIEVKSGKNYKRHNALNSVMAVPNYDIKKAYVLNNYPKIENNRGKIYMPIYMAMFLKSEGPRDFNFKIDYEPCVIPPMTKN